MNLDIKAANIQIEATENMTLKSRSTLIINGALVEIN